MEIFRDSIGNIARSPKFQLYGQKDDTHFIVPLSVCLYQLIAGNEKLTSDITDGACIGAAIKKITASKLTGKIKSCSWPPVGHVRPFVIVEKDGDFDVASLPSGVIIARPNVAIGDEVFLEKINSDFSTENISPGLIGKITALPASGQAYGDSSRNITAYKINFNQLILNDFHGARVVLKSTNELLGMLVASQNVSNPNSLALVHPAELIT